MQMKQTLELGEQRSSAQQQLDETTQHQLSNLHTKIANLEAALVVKDQELQAADVRYKKCVEKAKEVIKTLDAHAISGKTNPQNFFK